MKTIKFLFIFICVAILFSCSKKDEEISLPIGENTVYYYLDGALIMPQGFIAGISAVKSIDYAGCSNPDQTIILNFNNKIERFSICIKQGIQSEGVITLFGSNGYSFCNNPETHAYLEMWDSVATNTINYYTKPLTGNVIITYLSANKRKFSGTFKATLYSVNGEQKEITGGVFDINLDTL